jgi:UDP-3-O-[3-hydroxymyristoyl] glucosamine N-acyltransferase
VGDKVLEQQHPTQEISSKARRTAVTHAMKKKHPNRISCVKSKKNCKLTPRSGKTTCFATLAWNNHCQSKKNWMHVKTTVTVYFKQCRSTLKLTKRHDRLCTIVHVVFFKDTGHGCVMFCVCNMTFHMGETSENTGNIILKK